MWIDGARKKGGIEWKEKEEQKKQRWRAELNALCLKFHSPMSESPCLNKLPQFTAFRQDTRSLFLYFFLSLIKFLYSKMNK